MGSMHIEQQILEAEKRLLAAILDKDLARLSKKSFEAVRKGSLKI
jgi:hypothetical protein